VTCLDDAWGRLGPVGGDGMHLARDLGTQLEEDEGAVLGPLHTEVEPLVRLLVHESVPGRGCTQSMAPELVRAVGGVGSCVEEGLVVVGPGHAVRGPLDLAGHIDPRLQVAHPKREPLVAGGVHPVCQTAVSRAHREVGDIEVGPLAGQRVLVQEHLLVRPRPEVDPASVADVPGGVSASGPFPCTGSRQWMA